MNFRQITNQIPFPNPSDGLTDNFGKIVTCKIPQKAWLAGIQLFATVRTHSSIGTPATPTIDNFSRLVKRVSLKGKWNGDEVPVDIDGPALIHRNAQQRGFIDRDTLTNAFIPAASIAVSTAYQLMYDIPCGPVLVPDPVRSRFALPLPFYDDDLILEVELATKAEILATFPTLSAFPGVELIAVPTYLDIQGVNPLAVQPDGQPFHIRSELKSRYLNLTATGEVETDKIPDGGLLCDIHLLPYATSARAAFGALASTTLGSENAKVDLVWRDTTIRSEAPRFMRANNFAAMSPFTVATLPTVAMLIDLIADRETLSDVSSFASALPLDRAALDGGTCRVIVRNNPTASQYLVATHFKILRPK